MRLFKAVPIRKGTEINNSPRDAMIDYANISSATIRRGFIFTPNVVANYNESELNNLIAVASEEFGLTPQQMNSTFHKSWAKVRDTPLFQLVIEQILHYITTYGFERLGVYSENTVFIPSESLEIPDLEGGITLTIIKGLTKAELKEKLLTLLSRGIALKEETLEDVIDVALFVGINEGDIERIRNKETKAILYDYLGLVPENPIEFLRFLVYKTTNKTLLIKNAGTIAKIKETQNVNALKYFLRYKEKHSLVPLARIFFRFKPLFLAFRTNTQMKVIINKIRRLADTHHKPMREDYLNMLTGMIKSGVPIIASQLDKELARVNTFRKIRLAYALNFRTKDVDSILYKIRNGKSYAKSFDFPRNKAAKLNGILTQVLSSIVEDMRPNVEGKHIYIPENLVYALPATEKQFTGNFPSGSYVVVPKDMIFGVYWEDVKEHRIDLDLSVINAEGTKYGWDANYRSGGATILFSGDMTEAHKGATELFYVAKQDPNSLIMMVNYFNFSERVPVPYKIIVAKRKLNTLEQNYMVNPNDVACIAKSKIDTKQKILGLIVTTPDECRFYFSESDIGNSISSYRNDYTVHSRKYLFTFYSNAISLNELLELAGAEIVTEKSEDVEIDIDLSPETLEKDTIINLLSKSK